MYALSILLCYIVRMSTARLVSLAAIIAVAGAGAFFLNTQNGPDDAGTPTPPRQSTFDGKNATFTIDGKTVTLIQGVSRLPTVSGSASVVTTRYFGNESTGDLNGDGLADVAFLVTQETGGSGLFYYVVVALKTATSYKTTNAFFIGDRIAPQTTEIHPDSRELYVNFAERKPGEPMTADPTVGATLLLAVTPDGVLEGLMK